MWAILALGSSVAFCFVSLCDKRLLSFHLYGVPPLCLWCGVSGTSYGVVMLLAVGIPSGIPWTVAITPILAGLLMGCSVVLLFRALRLMEASRAIALSQTNPIFVAVLALLFLGERISPVQWASIGLVVAGAALISLRLFHAAPNARLTARSSDRETGGVASAPRNLTRIGSIGPVLLVLSSICAASSFVLAKAGLNAELPVLTVFALQQATVGLVFVAAGLTGGRRLVSAVRQPQVLAMLIFGESIMPAVSILLLVYAYSLGDASVVAAVLATRPLFVFVASTVLSRVRWQLLDETLTPQALAVKGASVLMIVGGVSALSLA